VTKPEEDSFLGHGAIVVSWRMTDVSEVLNACIIRANAFTTLVMKAVRTLNIGLLLRDWHIFTELSQIHARQRENLKLHSMTTSLPTSIAGLRFTKQISTLNLENLYEKTSVI
jgi:hypothetical protein